MPRHRIDRIQHDIIGGQCGNPPQRGLLLAEPFLFLLLLHLRVNNADAQDDAIAAAHSGDLHVDIHRRSGVNQAIACRKHALRVQFPEHVFPREDLQEALPVVLIDARHRIASGRGEEIDAFSLFLQFLPADLGGVFRVFIGIQINDVNIIIVGREGSGDVRVGCTLIRRRDRKHGKSDRIASGDGTLGEDTRKGMGA